MELLADRDPEEARKLLDSVVERMMEAVHRYEGTVNQVMGDGIMALFGAPLAHEDHAVRACYAALRMQELVKRYAEDARRAHGVNVQIRVGLNSGEAVVRAIGSDLHMDYTAVGQTTHLAARMEQLASPGSILLTRSTLDLAEGFVAVKPLGPMLVKGLADAVEVYAATGRAIEAFPDQLGHAPGCSAHRDPARSVRCRERRGPLPQGAGVDLHALGADPSRRVGEPPGPEPGLRLLVHAFHGATDVRRARKLQRDRAALARLQQVIGQLERDGAHRYAS
jgi:class 3 adenylate cyclase